MRDVWSWTEQHTVFCLRGYASLVTELQRDNASLRTQLAFALRVLRTVRILGRTRRRFCEQCSVRETAGRRARYCEECRSMRMKARLQHRAYETV